MNTDVFEAMVVVIEAERERRASLVSDPDADWFWDQWLYTHAPFVGELSLMLLLALRHQIERELISLAAQATEDREEISGQEYRARVEKLRVVDKKGEKVWDWATIHDRLKTNRYGRYQAIKVLRFLANSYKHDLLEPDRGLLKQLKLDTGAKYAPLSESEVLRQRLAGCVGLEKDADYCDIARAFVRTATDFIEFVRGQTNLSRINWGPVSFTDFAL